MFFDGKTKKKKVNLSGKSRKDDRHTLLKKAREERQEREVNRKKEDAARRIQGSWRPFHKMLSWHATQQDEFNTELSKIQNHDQKNHQTILKLKSALHRFVFFCNFSYHTKDIQHLDNLCQLILNHKKFAVLGILEETHLSYCIYVARLASIIMSSLLIEIERINHQNRHQMDLNRQLARLETLQILLPSPLLEKYPNALYNISKVAARKGFFNQVRRLMSYGMQSSKLSSDLYSSIKKIVQLFSTSPPNISSEHKPVLISIEDKRFGWEIARHVLSLPNTALYFQSDSNSVQSILLRIVNGIYEYMSFESLPHEMNDLPSSQICLLGNLLELIAQMKNIDFLKYPYIKILNQLISNISPIWFKKSDQDNLEIEVHDQKLDFYNSIIRKQLDYLFHGNHIRSLYNIYRNEMNDTDREASIAVPILSQLCSLFRTCLQYLEPVNSAPYLQLLGTIASVPHFLIDTWQFCSDHRHSIINQNISMSEEIMHVVVLFNLTYSHLLEILDNDEFFHQQKPFQLKQVVDISAVFRDCIYYMTKSRSSTRSELMDSLIVLLRKLHDRDTRTPFCPNEHWTIQELSMPYFSSIRGVDLDEDGSMEQQSVEEDPRPDRSQRYRSLNTRRMESLRNAMSPSASSSGRNTPLSIDFSAKAALSILRHTPFLVPFQVRLQLFLSFISQDQETVPDTWHNPSFIRRNHIFEDGFLLLHDLPSSQWKTRLQVQFKDEYGRIEEGIGEGVFKEFLESLIKTAFNPSYGLFKSTAEGTLYPNPSSGEVNPDYLAHFEFLGRVLGKALYEGILVELPFARFFLAKLLGKSCFLNDLPYLDPELYRNLMFLKNYDGDLEDLGLTFTITDDHFGRVVETPLIPNGENIAVTRSNRWHYIHRVAYYRLNVQLRHPIRSFVTGLYSIIPRCWLTMFDTMELEKIICGDEDESFDVDDLQEHVIYANGYTADHSTIKIFWQVVREFNAVERRALLKFVTSCSRVPLLGFRNLHPRFCISKSVEHQSHLPTSSTCVNLLKLPSYSSKSNMREKLLTAIENCTTFEFS